MGTREIVVELDAQLARLREARALLTGSNGRVVTKRGSRKRPVLSAEARKRIGDAQRRRWAKQKKAAK